MKIIFLDIDGVLNVISQGRDRYGSIFHKEFVQNLEILIKETDAKIVLSSTWRTSGLKVIQNMWKFRNLPGEVIDITPTSRWMDKDELDDHDRGYEIKAWLESRKDVSKYVIIDDVEKEFLDYQKEFLVKTYKNDHIDSIRGYGFTKTCMEIAINILN